MNPNASLLEIGRRERGRMSRARGPHNAKQHVAPVTSAMRTDASRRRAWRRSHDWSCDPNAVPVTIENTSSAIRVTVKSHSMPPRLFNACV